MFNDKKETCKGCPFVVDKKLRSEIGVKNSFGYGDFCAISAVLHDGLFERTSEDKECSCKKLKNKLIKRLRKKIRKDIIRRLRK